MCTLYFRVILYDCVCTRVCRYISYHCGLAGGNPEGYMPSGRAEPGNLIDDRCCIRQLAHADRRKVCRAARGNSGPYRPRHHA